ncbi:CIC11C00000004359 [Sungouiella intermedia]|uniref:CIC11C00000004359 n=1 Tax=Sungouiella intermedia TaxID=45354 RepID=A0A1L0BSQ2_9ASCO|nr:CIC11C00000004359 [[Candida] intermedia]
MAGSYAGATSPSMLSQPPSPPHSPSQTVLYHARLPKLLDSNDLDDLNESSLFITDPSRSVDFPSGIPDDLEFDKSSSAERVPSRSSTPSAVENRVKSPLFSQSPPPIRSPEFGLRQNRPNSSANTYSPFESPPRVDEPLSSDDEVTNFQDSSFADDTRAQFDLDISIENKVVNGSAKLSPWRKFSANPTQPGSLRHSSLLSKRVVTQNSIAETSSAKRLEDVTRELTNCKIQLKLYEKFLQELIDRHQIDVGDLEELLGSFSKKSLSTLEQEHADMCALVEDLYASLEEFQGKWHDADRRVMDLDHRLHELAFGVSDLLGSLGTSVDIDPGKEPAIFLENALSTLKEKIEDISKGASDEYQRAMQDLKSEYEDYKKDNSSAEKMLREQLHEISKWKLDYLLLKEKYDQLKDHSASSEFEQLQKENQRLSSLNRVVDDKLQEYQVMINQLQREVNEFKDLSRKGSLSDLSDPSVYTSLRDRERYLLLQRDFENLQRLHDDMANEFERFKETSAGTVTSLTNQLNNRKRDIMSLRAEQTGLENIQHELEVAIEKQRVLTSEKMKLAWQVDSLSKDKTSLQGAVDRLTDKLTASAVSESGNSQLDIDRQHFESMFRLDVWEFQRLFKSFNKIADDSSLEGPKLKINTLAESAAQKVVLADSVEFATLRDTHKSVFDYFARAVETIVNDHIRLLLKENETENKSPDVQVTKLQRKISTLEKQLQQSQTKLTNALNMRIEELTNRWKVEREARVHDNEQAKKRLQQLEEENERLRSMH